MDLAFDHVVVDVPDLAEAVRDFTAAGFVVVPGGRHDAIPTENALVAFADGGYLELLALRDPEARESLRLRSSRPGWQAELRRGPAIARRFLPHLAGAPGVADFVVYGAHLARAAAELRRRGFQATGPVEMHRERQDGVRLEWQLVLPAMARYPILIEDRTARSLRVPGDPASCAHPNQVRGVAEIRVRVPDLVPAALEYADLFGVHPRSRPDGAAFEFGGVRVVLELGEPEGARAVTLRGPGSLPARLESLGLGIADAR